MEFVIERTSETLHDKTKPVEKAYLSTVFYQKFPKSIEEQAYCIDIDSLDELVELAEKVEIIINTDKYNIPTIEIYDDHRE